MLIITLLVIQINRKTYFQGDQNIPILDPLVGTYRIWLRPKLVLLISWMCEEIRKGFVVNSLPPIIKLIPSMRRNQESLRIFIFQLLNRQLKIIKSFVTMSCVKIDFNKHILNVLHFVQATSVHKSRPQELAFWEPSFFFKEDIMKYWVCTCVEHKFYRFLDVHRFIIQNQLLHFEQ